MADNVTFQAATLATPPSGTKVSSDENATSGQLQRVKLAYSGDGLDTHVPADADGLLVNLGANNDVSVTGVATLAEQQTQTTALQLIDDVVHASDAALGKVAAIGAQFDDTAPGTTTENNVRPLRMSTRRELYGQIRDAAGNERGANVTAGNALVVDGSASTQPVSGTVTANQGTAGAAWEQVGDVAHDAPGATVNPLATGGYASAAAPADVSADSDVVRAWHLRNGSAAVTVTAAGALIGGDAANGLDVDVTRLPALVAGTANIGDVDVASIAAGDNNIGNVDVVSGPTGASAIQVQGTVAVDVAAANNPVLVGSSRETMADSAPANRVTADAEVERLSTSDGAIYVIPTGPQTFTLHATGVQTGAQIHAAPGAGLSCYITAISFSIGAATASSVKVLNNGGADIWGPHYLEAINGRGLHVTFPTPLKGTANTRIDVTTTGAATQTVDIQGFIGPG